MSTATAERPSVKVEAVIVDQGPELVALDGPGAAFVADLQSRLCAQGHVLSGAIMREFHLGYYPPILFAGFDTDDRGPYVELIVDLRSGPGIGPNERSINKIGYVLYEMAGNDASKVALTLWWPEETATEALG